MSNYHASRKIGVKLLDPDQLRFTFPQYEDFKLRIDRQRDRAKPSDQPDNSGLHLMHDNLYAIFGGRGTGKTSVLYSLREHFLIHKDDYGDIMLPIIMPEIIPSKDNSLLGWVLSMFEDVVNELEFQQAGEAVPLNFRSDTESPFFENCGFQGKKTLRQIYEQTYRDCFRQMDAVSRQYSYSEYIDMRSLESRAQYQLMKELNQFWDRVADTSYQIQTRKKGERPAKRPLIFLMFDDIDLEPDRSMELLGSAFKYFSNANVAIILTAAEKTLKDVLRCKMYEKVVGSGYSSLLQGNMLDLTNRDDEYGLPRNTLESGRNRDGIYPLEKADRAEEEYLNKVIPPSSRYTLNRYQDVANKLLFRYSSDYVENLSHFPDASWEKEASNRDSETSRPIEALLKGEIDRLVEKCKLLTPGGKRSRNFLYLKQPSEFLNAYLLIFGEKNRNIANGCLAILNTVDELIHLLEQEEKKQKGKDRDESGDEKVPKSGEDNWALYQILSHLFRVFLDSNPKVQKYQEYRDTLLQYRRGDWFLYVNYEEVLNLYDQATQNLRERMESATYGRLSSPSLEKFRKEFGRIKSELSILFVMMCFIEHLILLMRPGRKNVHGYKEIIILLNRDVFDEARQMQGTSLLKLFQSKDNIDEILYAYYPVLENPAPFILFDQDNTENLFQYFSTVYYNDNRLSELSVENKKANHPLFLEGDTSLLESNFWQDPAWGRTVLYLLKSLESGALMMSRVEITALQRFCYQIQIWDFGLPIVETIRFRFHRLLQLGVRGRFNLVQYSEFQVKRFQRFLHNSPSVKPPLLNQAKLTQDFAALLESLKGSDIEDPAIFSRLYKHWPGEFFQSSPLRPFCTKLTRLYESLIAQIESRLSYNSFEVHVPSEEANSLFGYLNLLGRYSESIRRYSTPLQNALAANIDHLQDQKRKKYIPLPAGLYFRLAWESYQSVLESDLASNFTMDDLYEPFGHMLSYCGTFSRGKESPVHLYELGLDMQLLLCLTPYYFYAKFWMENANQYHSKSIDPNQNADPSQARFLKIYQDIESHVRNQRKVEKTFNITPSLVVRALEQAEDELVERYMSILPE